MIKSKHKPVLLQEVLNGLEVAPKSIVVDVTLGGAGHALKILDEMNYQGVFVAFDVDINSIDRFKKHIEENVTGKLSKIDENIWKFENKELKIFFINENFKNIIVDLKKCGLSKVNRIYADLGFSTDQLESDENGLSFLNDTELDMRLDKTLAVKAKDLINGLYEKELSNLFWKLGDIVFSRALAREIVKARKEKLFETTGDLRLLVQKVIPFQYRRGSNKHPEAKVFQALRIAVNHELEALRTFLPLALESLSPEGRLAVISFHSGEDRIVKDYIVQKLKKNKIKLVSKLIKPSTKEIEINNNSRSAKLRIIEKL